jgi:hypothetical protein
MRKVDPADVRQDFQDETTRLVNHFRRTRDRLAGSIHELADVSELARTTYAVLYTAFERFLSDLFISYINRDCSAYATSLGSRVEASIRDKFGPEAASHLTFQLPAHLSLASVEALLDQDGRNLTFSSVARIKDRASDWLVPAHLARINALGIAEERAIDTAHSIRDFIAHNSIAAKSVMNERLASVSLGGTNRYLGRGALEVHNVGSFLKAIFAGEHRVVHYANRLSAIAATM